MLHQTSPVAVHQVVYSEKRVLGSFTFRARFSPKTGLADVAG